MAQGINIESLSFDLEGDLDLRAFLGLSEEVRPGYEGIRLTYRVKSDAPREKGDYIAPSFYGSTRRLSGEGLRSQGPPQSSTSVSAASHRRDIFNSLQVITPE